MPHPARPAGVMIFGGLVNSGGKETTQAGDKHRVVRCAPRFFREGAMRRITVIHHSDHRTERNPCAPGVCRPSPAPAPSVYHTRPSRDDELDWPTTTRPGT